MMERLFAVGFWRAGFWYRAGLGLVVVAGLCALPAPAQGGLFSRHKATSEPPQPAKSGVSPSQPPAFSHPRRTTWASSHRARFIKARESLVSLDFLDEDQLLFTFHVPGLIRREGNPAVENERQIRAVVLNLPDGCVTCRGALDTCTIEAATCGWLKDGHFLLRDRKRLQVGDGRLETRPLFHFQGPLLWLEMDPTQEMIVADSREAPRGRRQRGRRSESATASANLGIDVLEMNPESPDIVLRILRRVYGQVMLVSRMRTTCTWRLILRDMSRFCSGKGHEWVLNLNYF